MKKLNIKPNLPATMLIVLGVVIIILAILFFAVDPTNKESAPIQLEAIKIA